MTSLCERCGMGHRSSGTRCDWCASPACVRVPLWIVGRRRLLQSRLAAALRGRGALVAGVAAGIVLHLAVAVIGVQAGLPGLWQVGFFWSDWWSLVPEPAQPWLFATVNGAAYGALAGGVAGRPPLHAFRAIPVAWSPAAVTALTALVLSVWDTSFSTQYSLIAGALGAAVGRMTSLMMRGSRS